jgi:predicted transcriptional regulator
VITLTEKPLDAGGWFVIHNWVFDVALRQLSPNAFKLLCVAIRQTWGWKDPLTDSGRKEADEISYSQFREKAGIKSDATIRRALQECLEAGYILRQQTGRVTGTGAARYSYFLNRDYEAPATETVAAPTTETVAAPATETVETKEQKRHQNKGGDGDGSCPVCLELLLQTGYDSTAAANRARAAHQAWNGDACQNVAYWEKDSLEREQRGELRNRLGYLWSKIEDGAQPPKRKKAESSRAERYGGGAYAEFIQT